MGAQSNLYELASRSFLVLEPEWTVGKVLDLLAALDPEYVLIPTPGGIEDGSLTFHGATYVDIELRLSQASEELRLDQIPEWLRDLDPLPTCDAYLPLHEAPDVCLVVDEDQVVGVWDAYDNLGPWRSGDDGAHRLEVDYEPEVELDAETHLLVFLETGDHLPVQESFPVDVAAGSEIEVRVRPRKGFVAVGSRSAGLLVPEPGGKEDSQDPSPTVFRLRATEPGVGRVEIHALCQGQHLGRLVVASRVRPSEEPDGNAGSTPLRAEGTSSARLRPLPKERPDLTLAIFETRTAHGTELELRFLAKGSAEESFGPFPVHGNAHEQMHRLFGDLEDARGFTSHPAIRRQLTQTGATLFERLLPEPVQRRLWGLKDRIDTVQILSDEVVIPWELCVLCGREDGRTVEGDHFCEAFALTRWWSGGDPVRELPLCKMGVVAPPDSGLPNAQEEARFLLSRATSGCSVDRLPDSYTDLIEVFDRGQYGAIHFTGHGLAVTDSGDWASIDLSEGEFLRPIDLNGIASNLGLAKPLVFLNACRTGYGGQALHGIGGWATQFLRIGAGAFVGTLWSVRTRSARRFAEIFYKTLFEGATISHAARTARCTVRDEFPDKTTWLAYTVFADPLARFVRAEPTGPSPRRGRRGSEESARIGATSHAAPRKALESAQPAMRRREKHSSRRNQPCGVEKSTRVGATSGCRSE